MNAVKLSWLARVLLVCLALHTQWSLAHLPEHYGREYIRLPETPGGAPTTPPTPELSRPAPDPSEYEEQLDAVEQVSGPYAAGKTDPLLGMGHYYIRRGNAEKALGAYRQALHSVRINDGLYSEHQIPILREIMKVYREVGDFQALDETYQYYYRLRDIDAMPHTQEWLESGLEYLAWERALYASRSVANQRAPLMRAYRANKNMLESLQPSTTEELDWHFQLCLSHMLNFYLIMGGEPLAMSVSLNSREGPAVDAVNREYAFIQKTALGKGKKLLQACIETARASPVTVLAALHLELGDWHQWNEQLKNAGEQYSLVVKLLRTAGEDHLLMQWLDEPRELPSKSDLWAVQQHALTSDRVVVEALYDVTSRGDVRHIEVSVADEEKAWQAWRIKRMLRDTHFRPRYSQGVAEGVEKLSRRYMLVDVH